MSRSKTYETLRSRIDSVPVINTHEHFDGPADQPKHTEPITSLTLGYVRKDLVTAVGGTAIHDTLIDPDVSTEKKWPLFQQVWQRMQHTAYARVTKLILANEYGLLDVSLEALKGIAGKLVDYRDERAYLARMDQSGIRCNLANVSPDWKKVLDGSHQVHSRSRLLISCPQLHAVRAFDDVQTIAGWQGRAVTCLDEYVDVLRSHCTRLKERGAIGMKDQSAYGRIIRYENGTRAEAERLFGLIMEDPRTALGYPQAKPLGDFLFHELMRTARDLDLPVQIHTGYLAGTYNDVAKANAAHFRSVLETHRDVRFDLFHGNWPYAGDFLFLGKNYPNVSLDCCWLPCMDPRYARRLLADAVVVVPQSKVFAFGGDYGALEYTCAHLVIARDVVAASLAEMVDDDWIGMEDACHIAADWLFNNPNEFYRLGFEPVSA